MTSRVGVTTAADGAGRQVEALARVGLEGVALPCVEVVICGHLEEIRRAVSSAELAVVTSPRTVRILWPKGGMPPIPVAAVGPRTAEAVGAAGGTVAIIGRGGAADLAARLAGTVGGVDVVFPRARAADPETETKLREAGAQVQAFVVYETIPVPPPPDPVELALFGSPSAVEGWVMSRSLHDITPVAMGATTAAAIKARGVIDPVVAEKPGLRPFVEAARVVSQERRSA